MKSWKDIVSQNTNGSTSNKTVHKKGNETIQEDDEKPDKIIKYVAKDISQKIVKARVKLGIKRNELAQRLSISEDIIKDCEIGGQRPSEKVMNKILNFVHKTLA